MSLSPRIDTIEAQYKPTLMTAQTASGTVVDFPGIPSWVKKITVIFSGVSTNGTSIPLIQLGTSSGYETSGYTGCAHGMFTTLSGTNISAGFLTTVDGTGTYVRHGVLTLYNVSGNTWVGAGTTSHSDTGRSSVMGGSKTLSSTLDRVRVTTVNGTDAFDAGSINVLYE